jgi:hypothetical protein
MLSSSEDPLRALRHFHHRNLNCHRDSSKGSNSETHLLNRLKRSTPDSQNSPATPQNTNAVYFIVEEFSLEDFLDSAIFTTRILSTKNLSHKLSIQPPNVLDHNFLIQRFRRFTLKAMTTKGTDTATEIATRGIISTIVDDRKQPSNDV